jgi:hypothetical protein
MPIARQHFSSPDTSPPSRGLLCKYFASFYRKYLHSTEFFCIFAADKSKNSQNEKTNVCKQAQPQDHGGIGGDVGSDHRHYISDYQGKHGP